MAVAGILHRWTMDNFAQQRGPDGKAWPKLKNPRPSRGENLQILQHKGFLRDSIKTQFETWFGAAFAAIGTNRGYARIPPFGGPSSARPCGVLRLRTKNRRGDLFRRKGAPHFAVFANKDHKRFVERRCEAAAYTINLPAWPTCRFRARNCRPASRHGSLRH